jgi:uncharacterized damage-inducible protein DinB
MVKPLPSMSASTLLQSLFRYKAWANEELFAELDKLDPVAHQAERHAAIRLLNHIHVVDRIFAAHLSDQVHGHTATNTVDTPSLETLRSAVAEVDRWYVDYVAGLPAEQLTERLQFSFTDGADGCMSREEMLAHVATHGGYHRGAVGRIMAEVSVPPPRDIFTVYLHRTEPERRLRTPPHVAAATPEGQ